MAGVLGTLLHLGHIAASTGTGGQLTAQLDASTQAAAGAHVWTLADLFLFFKPKVLSSAACKVCTRQL